MLPKDAEAGAETILSCAFSKPLLWKFYELLGAL